MAAGGGRRRAGAGAQVDGAGGAWREGDGDSLGALAQNGEGAVSALQAERLDVRPGRFGDPQPVQREERDERVLSGGAESRSDEQGADVARGPGRWRGTRSRSGDGGHAPLGSAR